MKKDFIFAPAMLLIGALLFLLRATGIAALAIVHKASAALFVVLLIVLFVHKLLAAKKA